MKTDTIKSAVLPLAAVALSIGIGFAGITAADTTSGTGTGIVGHVRAMFSGAGEGKPVAFGKISAISGTTITVAQTNQKDSTVTTYTVDAANAKITKAAQGAAPSTITIAGLSVGDSVAVRGTVSGTNVTATDIMDGVPGMGLGRGGMMKGGMGMEHGGNGVSGTVTAVNGNTVTVTGKDGKTYTVDASGSEILKTSTITAAQIAVGDTLGIHGTVSGTSIKAEHIMDGVLPMHGADNDDK
ncbi:DUF5666 domain-containing protein [Candidatus Kaiserbacteria bacterium]|nr:DUF5666 domain-containing protein [Candidatus Kaiserbacteria bacterium]